MTPAQHKAEAERLAAGDDGAVATAQVHALLYIGGLIEAAAEQVAVCQHGATGLCMNCILLRET